MRFVGDANAVLHSVTGARKAVNQSLKSGVCVHVAASLVVGMWPKSSGECCMGRTQIAVRACSFGDEEEEVAADSASVLLHLTDESPAIMQGRTTQLLSRLSCCGTCIVWRWRSQLLLIVTYSRHSSFCVHCRARAEPELHGLP